MKPRFIALSAVAVAGLVAFLYANSMGDGVVPPTVVEPVVEVISQPVVPGLDHSLSIADEPPVVRPQGYVRKRAATIFRLTRRPGEKVVSLRVADQSRPPLALPASMANTGLPEVVPEDAGLTFEIRHYEFSGNTLLAAAEIAELLSHHTSPTASFATIQGAIAALEGRYLEHDFGAVKVVLPEQDIENGVVQLRIVEGRIGQIIVKGQKFFSEQNIRASIPALYEGVHPNMRLIDASLRVANEHPAKQTVLTFRQGSHPGEVDAYIGVSDENPLRVALSMDNTGSPGNDGKYSTGRYRTAFIVQHSNMFDKDHALSFQYQTSPDFLSKVKIFGAGYRIPLYATGDALDFSIGYSNVNSGKITTAAGPIGISGSGQTYSFKYDQSLPKWGEWQQKLLYGIDYRIYSNTVKTEGATDSLVPNATVHPLSLSYSGSMRLESKEVAANFTFVQNIPGGTDGKTTDFQKPGGRAGASANYQILRYNLSATQMLPGDWTMKMAFSGQKTRDALISGELFGVGGSDSVRGFFEREVSNDKGHRGSVELYTPELGGFIGQSDLRLRALAFYDVGQVSRNKPQPGEQLSQSIASTGLGLRASMSKNLSIRLDWGVVTNAGGNRQDGDSRVHASLIGSF